MTEYDVIRAIARYWPIILTLIGLVVWAVRLEAGQRSNRDRIASSWREVEAHYATKEKVAEVQGYIDTFTPQLHSMRQSQERIESKLDAFIVGLAREHHNHQTRGGRA